VQEVIAPGKSGLKVSPQFEPIDTGERSKRCVLNVTQVLSQLASLEHRGPLGARPGATLNARRPRLEQCLHGRIEAVGVVAEAGGRGVVERVRLEPLALLDPKSFEVAKKKVAGALRTQQGNARAARVEHPVHDALDSRRLHALRVILIQVQLIEDAPRKQIRKFLGGERSQIE
jgi:hypothetical protein